MRRTFVLTAALTTPMLLLLNSCARNEKSVLISNGAVLQAQSNSEGAERVRAGGAPYTNFCQKQFFKESGGKLFCNWGASFAEACAITFPSDKYIEKGAVISGPEEIGSCSDGNTVLKVTNN
jgi:hypothetical protein